MTTYTARPVEPTALKELRSADDAGPETGSEAAGQGRARVRAENVARIRGHELATLRKETGLTQGDVARVLGVSQARVSQTENGQVDSLDVLRACADALGGEVAVIVRRGDVSVEVA